MTFTKFLIKRLTKSSFFDLLAFKFMKLFTQISDILLTEVITFLITMIYLLIRNMGKVNFKTINKDKHILQYYKKKNEIFT